MMQISAQPRHDWTTDDIQGIYDLPLPELIFHAQRVHRLHHPQNQVQLATLLSIKTGGCPENCGYCPQSAHHDTGLSPTGLMSLDVVQERARHAKAAGATRLCMGAAWRQVRDGSQFDQVLCLVRAVADEGLEVCCTLGMLTTQQAQRLAAAGLTAYNHNLDSSPAYYGNIVSTRTYDERLATLEHVRRAGIDVCCGGIVGMGESVADRVALLGVLAHLTPHPESVPINALVRVAGTPLQDLPPVDPLDMVRMVATARIVLPVSRVRLSAGRQEMDEPTQALCFVAGANSIFLGDTLLTTPNPAEHVDRALLAKLGMKPMPPPADGARAP